MKSPWLAVFVVVVIVFLRMTPAHSNEPNKVSVPSADPMQGKEPGDVRDDNGLKMKFVWCPPGTFTMGSAKSDDDRSTDEVQARVTLGSGFWLGKYEVIRGGSWDYVAAQCRSGKRHWYRPHNRNDNVGFRVALSSVQPVK